MNRRERQVVELVTPTVASLGCEVWGVEHLSQGKHSKLRLYIERDDGVTVDHCAEVSRHVSDLLDVEEFSAAAYTLEVSSPGMDRILFTEAQYAAYAGSLVDVRLHVPFEGRKKVTGRLAGVEEQCVLVQVEDDEYVLPIENVQKARVIPEYEEVAKTSKQSKKQKRQAGGPALDVDKADQR